MSLGSLDYSIESAKITSSTGETLEIKDLIDGIDIYESVLSPYVKCEIAIIDAANLIESIPIIGQEKIVLTIKEAKNKVVKTFYVGSVTNYVRANNQAAMYTLKLITPEQMLNSLMLVSQAYSGTISDSIDKIVTDYLKGKVKTLEKSNGAYRVIIPNWNPFQAIDWLARRAIDDKQTPYAFYETFLDGHKFESFQTMLNKPILNKFVHKGAVDGQSDADTQKASFNVAFEYNMKDYSTIYRNALKGTFGAGLHTVDIATKSYNFLKYDYDTDFKKKTHLDKVPFINTEFKVEGKSLNQYDAIHHVVNKNTKAFAEDAFNNYNNEVEYTKLETDPYVMQLTLNKLNLAVRGRLELTAGSVIRFDVDRDKPLVGGNTGDVNRYISGKYLVLNTHHKMSNGKYVIILDVVRDSLGQKVKVRK